MTTPSNVEHRDIASGKIARVFSGAHDIVALDPSGPGGQGRGCRAIVAQGAVVITGMDGVNVSLPDLGNFWWDIQALAIVSGAGVIIY